jgi:prefoldin subunit 5
MFTVLYLAKQASKISKSIDALNEKIARVIERVDSHEVRLQAIEVHGKPSP